MPMVGIVSCSRYQPRDPGRHGLEFQHEAAGIFDRQRVLQDLHGRIRGAALNLEAAEHGDGMRSQADMGRGRNAGVHQRAQDMRLRFAALRLDRVAQRFLHETRGVDECAVDRVVALIRHASEHEGVRCATADSLPMHDHHVHGRRHRIAMAVRDHRQAIPEHRHVDAGHLRPLRRGVVRHRHVDHLLAGALRLADFRDRALLALALGFGDLGPGPGRFGRRGFGRRLR